MTIRTQLIEYDDNGTLLEGFLAFDEQLQSKSPAVLIAHPWAGRDQAICNRAIQMAKLGYVGFAGDMYGKGILGANPEENSRLMQPFIDNRGLIQNRMLKALETLREQSMIDPQRVAALGYCFGGMCVLDLARSGAQFSGAISVHGLLKAPEGLQPDSGMKAKVLVLHGYQDPLAPPQDVTDVQEELTRRQADWQVHLYGNTMHAFTNPIANDIEFGTVYNESADKRAWYSMTGFLNEIFNDNESDNSA